MGKVVIWIRILINAQFSLEMAGVTKWLTLRGDWSSLVTASVEVVIYNLVMVGGLMLLLLLWCQGMRRVPVLLCHHSSLLGHLNMASPHMSMVLFVFASVGCMSRWISLSCRLRTFHKGLLGNLR